MSSRKIASDGCFVRYQKISIVVSRENFVNTSNEFTSTRDIDCKTRERILFLLQMSDYVGRPNMKGLGNVVLLYREAPFLELHDHAHTKLWDILRQQRLQ